nr:MAG TPA: hypothetical protein [Caudoviricetes sp.]
MNDKILNNLLRNMFFNIHYFPVSVPGLVIGNRCFKIDISDSEEVNIFIRTYDDFSNKQVLSFNTEVMRVNSMTQYSEKESNICLSNFMYRTVIPRKAHSDFDTCKMFNQFNLYVHYIMFSFNYMYWR